MSDFQKYLKSQLEKITLEDAVQKEMTEYDLGNDVGLLIRETRNELGITQGRTIIEQECKVLSYFTVNPYINSFTIIPHPDNISQEPTNRDRPPNSRNPDSRNCR